MGGYEMRSDFELSAHDELELAFRLLKFDNAAQISDVSKAYIEKYKCAKEGKKPSEETQKFLKDLKKYPKGFQNTLPASGITAEERRELMKRNQGRSLIW